MEKKTRKSNKTGKSKPEPMDIAVLRKKAEKRLKEQTDRLGELSEKDVRQLAHELGTHQIELEMQNEELRRAQNELEASRSKYSDLYDFSPVGYFTFDKNGLIREVNLTGANLLGVERSNLINRPFSPFVDKDYRNAFHVHCAEVLKKHAMQTCEIRLRKKDGAGFHAQLQSIPIKDGDGTAVYCRTALSDITERKRGEEKLQKENREIALANRILRVFVEETGDDMYDKALNMVLEGMRSRHGVFGYIDENGVLVCPSLSKMLDQCEIEGKCIHYPPEKWKGLWARALKEKQALYTNKPPWVPPGHPLIRNNLAAPILFQGKAIGLLNLANKETDYTEEDRELMEGVAGRVAPVLYAWIQKEMRENERKQAEAEIKKINEELENRVRERTSELLTLNKELEAEIAERSRAEEAVKTERQRLYDVLETLPVYVVLLTPDYHVPFANRFFRERFGESHGRRCFEYLFDRNEPCEICETYTVLKTMAPRHWEWTGPDKRNYDIHDFPFIDSDGSTLILEMGIDITLQKQAEARIRKMNQELEQRVITRTAELETVNRELEAFSYTVSHDLKTPLRSIQGFAQALTEDFRDRLDDTGRDYLRRINSAGEKMTQLIDAMLEISRLTGRELMGKTVNLSSIAEVIAFELRKSEPDRNVEFLIGKGVKAQGDPALLEIVLRNLLDNAWKFTGRHASAEIAFGVMRMDGKDVCFVRDDGAGFDMRYAGKLFMPFQRFHPESEFPGIGIGLAIARKIVIKHGGKIWAEAGPEKGATFYFTLG